MNDSEYEILIEKINSLARNAPSNLQEELYPKKLGQRAMMLAPDLRLSVLSKYEGISSILKDLGADVSKLEDMVEKEAERTLEGKY